MNQNQKTSSTYQEVGIMFTRFVRLIESTVKGGNVPSVSASWHDHGMLLLLGLSRSCIATNSSDLVCD